MASAYRTEPWWRVILNLVLWAAIYAFVLRRDLFPVTLLKVALLLLLGGLSYCISHVSQRRLFPALARKVSMSWVVLVLVLASATAVTFSHHLALLLSLHTRMTEKTVYWFSFIFTIAALEFWINGSREESE